MHSFSREARELGVGTRVEDTPEMAAGPTGAAADDEHSNQVQNDDVGTAEQSHKRRLILLMHNEQKTVFIFFV